jgi:tetratricopeptide (TPR) repeat protein
MAGGQTRQTTALFLLVLAAAGQAYFVWYAARGMWGWAWLVHIFSCFILSGALSVKRSGDLRREAFHTRAAAGVILTIFFPGAGIWAAIAAEAAVRMAGDRRSGVFEDYEQAVLEHERRGRLLSGSAHLLDHIREEIGFEPLTDIMRGRDAGLKIRAIDRLSRSLKAEHVRLLKNATRDISPEVRLYASSALLKLETQASNRMAEAEDQSRRSMSSESSSDLGRLYFEYSRSGLVDAVVGKHYVELAVKAYREALDREPANADIMTRYAVCLAEAGRAAEALRFSERAAPILKDKKEALLLRSALRFNTAAYASVGEGLERLAAEDLTPEEREAVEFWQK